MAKAVSTTRLIRLLTALVVLPAALSCRGAHDWEREPELKLPPRRDTVRDRTGKGTGRAGTEHFMLQRPMGSATLRDLDGRELELEELLAGKPLLLAFWDPDRTESVQALGQVYTRWRRYMAGTADMAAVATSASDETIAAATAAAGRNRWDLPLVFDIHGGLGAALGVASTPAFVVFDSDGLQTTRVVREPEAPTASGLDLYEMARRTAAGDRIPAKTWADFQSASCSTLGVKAPDFVLSNSYGRRFELADYNGRENVILVFFSLTCPHCLIAMPLVDAYYRANRERNNFEALAVILAGEGQGLDEIGRFASEYEFGFPILPDLVGEVFGAYGVTGTPAVMVVDKAGFVRLCLTGAKRDLAGILDGMFNELEK